jgi:UDP-N-acetylglucosamine 2-epimerase (non-hydrolysing)
MHVLTVFGTRPEALKMVPVVKQLEKHPDIKSTICVTGQHRDMLDQVLDLFDVKPDIDLDLMVQSQHLTNYLGNAVKKLGDVFREKKPDWVLVQGDTASTLAGGLAAFYEHIKVGHVEAGLRTYNYDHPWPEEMQRQVVRILGTMHFAPTYLARENLLKEGVSKDNAIVTGNTVIDTLIETTKIIKTDKSKTNPLDDRFSFLDDRRIILVTSHRRENLDGGQEQVCLALKDLALNHPFQIVFPVHLNPVVKKTVSNILGGIKNIHLIEPLDYLSFVYMMNRSWIIVTDSGGIQEEAPSLQKPVLVARETTERPEAVTAGTAELVGTDIEKIKSSVLNLLNDQDFYHRRSTYANPFGDGHASERIVECLLKAG